MKIETICSGDWLSIKKIDDWYEYCHDEVCNGKGVAILGFKKIEDGTYRFVGRYENCPCHFDGITLTSLTGMVEEEKGDTIESTAVKEMKEEAGIDITEDDLIYMGIVKESKMKDKKQYLFGVDVTDKEISKSIGDGTEGE